MDLRTGKIYKGFVDSLKKEIGHEDLISVNMNDATEKQKKEMQVSLKDHKSKLGKKLTENRKELTKNYLRKLKRKGVIK